MAIELLLKYNAAKSWGGCSQCSQRYRLLCKITDRQLSPDVTWRSEFRYIGSCNEITAKCILNEAPVLTSLVERCLTMIQGREYLKETVKSQFVSGENIHDLQQSRNIRKMTSDNLRTWQISKGRGGIFCGTNEATQFGTRTAEFPPVVNTWPMIDRTNQKD